MKKKKEQTPGELPVSDTESLFRLLAERMNDIAWTADLEMKVTYVSPSIEKVLGFTPEERMNQPLDEQMPPGTLRLAGEKLEEELRLDGERDPGRSITLDLDYYHKDGSIRVLETSLSFIRDKEGNPTGIYGLSRDVTERKQAEEALRESEERYRYLFDGSRDALMTLGPPLWRFTAGNPAACAMFGAGTEAEFTELGPWKLSPERQPDGRPSAEKAAEMIATAMREGSHFFEWTHKKLNGEDFPCTVLLTRIELAGQAFLQATVRDITERKQAEEAVLRSEDRYKQLSDATFEAIFISEQGLCIGQNKTAEMMFGYTDEEALGRMGTEWIHPDYRELVLKNILSGYEASYEAVAIRKDGSSFPCEIQARMHKEGESIRLTALRDITERKQAEEALRESESRFWAVFDRAKDGIFIETPEGKILDVNRAVTEMLGYTREELLEMRVGDLVPPEVAAKLSPAIRPETVAEGAYIETENVRKNGTRIPVEVGNSLVEIGGEERVIAIVRDISDRKKATEELKASEERFKNILFYAPLAIQGYRTDGTVAYWNREAERVYGYSTEEALGKNLGDLIIPEEIRPMFEESLSGCAGLKDSGEFMDAGEVSLRRKDGSRISVHSIHTAVCVAGEEPMLFCIDLDLTERKRMEAERLEMERRLQHTQRLESLGVLAGGIAHDFNNILMVILGNAELALREMGSLSPARESVSEISAASRQAAELCKQMLAYAGRASFSREPLDLAALIKETAHLIKVSISRGVVLKYELEPGLVEGDPAQLRQVVMNLVINSSEAIGERSGVVTIATGKVFLDEKEIRRRDPAGSLAAGEYVFLRVADNGRGMDEATRRRVFEPFFSTKFTGRGLGLAAVLGIVQGHGGTISVESEPELGTTFRVLFPALEKTEETRPAKGANDRFVPWAGSGTVLVAEDEERVRTLAGRILEEMGFSVLATADGREAVEVYREHGKGIDLVVLDLTMPHLDGAGALEEILKIDPEARVILASGFSEEELARRFRGRNLAGILQKPYSLETFTDAVRRALEK